MRHLTDPANKVYIQMMEGELYEVDVHTLEVTELYGDHPVAGSHAKGAYTSQGRMVMSNNGDRSWYPAWRKDPDYDGPTGVLAEWDGTEWNVVERKQFTEVTGPGGIYGAANDDDPIWATGWDRRSLILKLLDGGEWSTYRLPKASHTHDAGHGWYTEWPRIREVAPDRLLMTMHGMFFDFPKAFGSETSGGIRPISSYLKMVVDLCEWNGRLVFGCNDASVQEGNRFCNQPSSNLWFGTLDDLGTFGPTAGWGGPWVNDQVAANAPSDAYLVGGFKTRVIHLAHDSDAPVVFTLEVDESGADEWTKYRSIATPAEGYTYHLLPTSLEAEWLRVSVDRDCTATAFLHYLPDGPPADAGGDFASLAPMEHATARTTGIIRPRGGDLGTLHYLAERVEADGTVERLGYYEIGEEMRLEPVDDPTAAGWLEENFALGEPDFEIDDASVIVTDFRGRRFRLPKTSAANDEAWPEGWPRGMREVVTERRLLNCHGTIYELPHDSSGGIIGMKPVCTHGKHIADFCSWRGMLVLAGNLASAEADGHYFGSTDGKTGLWFGNVDDLWRLGQPRGEGGPWKDTEVAAGEPSDPYLMTGYRHKTLELSHDSNESVAITLEVDVTGTGEWHPYKTVTIGTGEVEAHEFPAAYSAHWIRFTASADCAATAWLTYE